MEQQLDLFFDAKSDEMMQLHFVQMESKIVKIRKGVFSRLTQLTKIVIDQEKEIESLNESVANLQKQLDALVENQKNPFRCINNNLLSL